MDVFRSMQVFVQVVQAGSMSAAASQVGVTPAMVGQHIAALEDRLGTRLLHRTTRRQSLTDFGESYYAQCRDILARVALTEQAADQLRTEAQGTLRLTAPMTFGTEMLMPALRAYRDSAPNVSIDVTLTDRTVDLAEEGFDLAFRIGDLADSSLLMRKIAPYRMMICAAPDYLARMGIPDHPVMLRDHDAVAFSPAAKGLWRLQKGDETVEVMPRSVVTVNSGQAVRTAAIAGLGIVMQPEMLLARDVAENRLVCLFADWQLRERPMSMVYHRDRMMTERLRGFIAFASSRFAGHD